MVVDHWHASHSFCSVRRALRRSGGARSALGPPRRAARASAQGPDPAQEYWCPPPSSIALIGLQVIFVGVILFTPWTLVTLLIARCLTGVSRRLCMFETKVNTYGEIKFTTFLGSGREPCQQAVQDFLGELLSHISK